MNLAEKLIALSRYIDAGNSHREREAMTWGRLAKVSEECGEVIAAYIGVTAQNPRKGVTHSIDDVQKELLDVAVTALGAYEHLDGHLGHVTVDLNYHLDHLLGRVGINPGE